MNLPKYHGCHGTMVFTTLTAAATNKSIELGKPANQKPLRVPHHIKVSQNLLLQSYRHLAMFNGNRHELEALKKKHAEDKTRQRLLLRK